MTGGRNERHIVTVTDPLVLLPLGGLGEIGMNCLAVEHGGESIMIDCGIMFPDRELGIDIIHPDFSGLFERKARLHAVVLTHGHEDHIGALPYLQRQRVVPVYGPPYALSLVRERLQDHGLADAVPLHAIHPGERVRIGPFEVEPIHVTHSIPDATALAIRTPVGVIIHSGDFKIDEAPPHEAPFDAARFAALGDEGVRLLLSDSTNVLREGSAASENVVAETIERLATACDGRIVLSMFASNVHRLRVAIRVAQATGRKLCILGRSLQTHSRIATELRQLPDAGALWVSPEQARTIPRRNLLVVAAGTQGEPAGALARLAEGTHRDIELEAGDQVILSARIIPGNEQSVFKIINDFERRDISVHHRAVEPGVHVSGHAHRGEQRRLLELVRPRAFVPLHGTLVHLRQHARLAQECGVKEILVVENGSIIVVDDVSLRTEGTFPTGRIHVDDGEELHDAVVRDRALLAELGIAVVVVQVHKDGTLAGQPDVLTRGVVHEELEESLLAGARRYVADELRNLRSPRYGADHELLRDRARAALKRYLKQQAGRRPLSYAVVVEVP